jgi:hypothetical protein
MKQKLSFLLFYLICFQFNVSAQDSDLINHRFTNSSQFLFNDYINADIKFKNGKSINADINYNLFFQEIWYKKSDQYLILKETDQFDYIELENFTFLINNGIIYDNIVSSDKYIILKLQKIDSQSLNKNNGAYGMSTVTASTTSLSSYITNSSGVNRSDISKKESEIEFDIICTYYISDNNGNIYSLTKRKLYSLFENKKDSIKKYIKANNISLRNEKDIIELFKYIVSL